MANLAIEDLADDNVRLHEHLASLTLSHEIYRQMLLLTLEMLWREHALREPHWRVLDAVRPR